MVFRSTRFTPDSEATASDRKSPYRVNRIIGVAGKIFRSLDAAVKPFMTGIERSKVMTSGLICVAASTASLPFSASTQVLKPSDKKSGSKHFPNRAIIIHNQDGLASAPLFGISFDFHRTDPRFSRLGAGYK